MLFGTITEFVTEICRRVLTFDEHLNPDYSKEHVKPLLNYQKILAVGNRYTYHSIIELFKIMKFRTPYSISEKLNISKRKVILYLPSKNKQNILYSAPQMWNTIHNHLIYPFIVIQKGLKLGRTIEEGIVTLNYDLSAKTSLVKTRLKIILFQIQAHGVGTEWRSFNVQLESYSKSSTLNIH